MRLLGIVLDVSRNDIEAALDYSQINNGLGTVNISVEAVIIPCRSSFHFVIS